MLPDSGFKNAGAGVSVSPLQFLNVDKMKHGALVLCI